MCRRSWTWCRSVKPAGIGLCPMRNARGVSEVKYNPCAYTLVTVPGHGCGGAGPGVPQPAVCQSGVRRAGRVAAGALPRAPSAYPGAAKPCRGGCARPGGPRAPAPGSALRGAASSFLSCTLGHAKQCVCTCSQRALCARAELGRDAYAPSGLGRWLLVRAARCGLTPAYRCHPFECIVCCVYLLSPALFNTAVTLLKCAVKVLALARVGALTGGMGKAHAGRIIIPNRTECGVFAVYLLSCCRGRGSRWATTCLPRWASTARLRTLQLGALCSSARPGQSKRF